MFSWCSYNYLSTRFISIPIYLILCTDLECCKSVAEMVTCLPPALLFHYYICLFLTWHLQLGIKAVSSSLISAIWNNLTRVADFWWSFLEDFFQMSHHTLLFFLSRNSWSWNVGPGAPEAMWGEGSYWWQDWHYSTWRLLRCWSYNVRFSRTKSYFNNHLFSSHLTSQLLAITVTPLSTPCLFVHGSKKTVWVGHAFHLQDFWPPVLVFPISDSSVSSWGKQLSHQFWLRMVVVMLGGWRLQNPFGMFFQITHF